MKILDSFTNTETGVDYLEVDTGDSLPLVIAKDDYDNLMKPDDTHFEEMMNLKNGDRIYLVDNKETATIEILQTELTPIAHCDDGTSFPLWSDDKFKIIHPTKK